MPRAAESRSRSTPPGSGAGTGPHPLLRGSEASATTSSPHRVRRLRPRGGPERPSNLSTDTQRTRDARAGTRAAGLPRPQARRPRGGAATANTWRPGPARAALAGRRPGSPARRCAVGAGLDEACGGSSSRERGRRPWCGSASARGLAPPPKPAALPPRELSHAA